MSEFVLEGLAEGHLPERPDVAEYAYHETTIGDEDVSVWLERFWGDKIRLTVEILEEEGV